MIDWLFRDRRTGAITVAQPPNAPVTVATIATVTRWVLTPEGAAGRALDGVALGAWTWWGVDEAARGVNPFRRLLGAAALVVLAGVTLRRRSPPPA